MPPPAQPSAVTVNRAAGYCQCRSVIVKDAAALLVVPSVAWRELLTLLLANVSPAWLRMPPPPLLSAAKPFVMVKPEMVTFEREIFKHAESGVAVDRQTSGTGAVDGHVVGNLKFAAGQQDGAGDAGGVNRVAVIRDGERVAQRAGTAVIGVCDYDDVTWQRIAESH